MIERLRLPYGSTITGIVTIKCQQPVARNGDICSMPVEIRCEETPIDELQDILDEDIHDRCPSCRASYLERMAEDESQSTIHE